MKQRHHNRLHLGDCLIHLNYLKRCCDLDPSLEFEFRVPCTFIKELSQFIPEPLGRIQLFPLDTPPPDSIDASMLADLEALIRTRQPVANTMKSIRRWQLDFGQFYVDFFHQFSQRWGLPRATIGVLDLVTHIPASVPPTIAAADCLVINAPSKSNEWKFDGNKFDRLIRRLIDCGNSVICTHPNHAGAYSTLKNGWTLAQVGRLAENCKNIIAVHTGPIWACLNPTALERVQFWLIFCKGHYLHFNERFQWSRTMDWGTQLLREYKLIT